MDIPYRSLIGTDKIVSASPVLERPLYVLCYVYNLSGRCCEDFRAPKSRPESVLVLSLEGRYLSGHGILGAAIKTYKKSTKYLFDGMFPSQKTNLLNLSGIKITRMTFKITRVQRLSAVIGISLSFFVAEISGKRMLDHDHC